MGTEWDRVMSPPPEHTHPFPPTPNRTNLYTKPSCVCSNKAVHVIIRALDGVVVDSVCWLVINRHVSQCRRILRHLELVRWLTISIVPK
jgi:hypothetical protein